MINKNKKDFILLDLGVFASKLDRCTVCDRNLTEGQKRIVRDFQSYLIGVEWRCGFCGSGYNHKDELKHLTIKHETMMGVS